MEKSSGSEDAGRPPPPLSAPPPTIPPNVKPERVTTTKYTITSRRGVRTTGSSCKSVEGFILILWNFDNGYKQCYMYLIIYFYVNIMLVWRHLWCC